MSSSGTGLDFDEFRALTQRNRAAKAKANATPTHASSKGKDDEDVSKTKKTSSGVIVALFKSILQYISNIVEQNELQALYVVLLLLDTFCSFMLVITNYGLLS